MQTLPRSEMKCKEDRLLTDFVFFTTKFGHFRDGRIIIKNVLNNSN